VRRLCEFNVSLLGKWCWRMLGENDRLWYRVLKARYGEEGRRLKESSSWWRMMCDIRNGVGLGVGSWFEDNIQRVVGGGRETYFWTDNWVGGVPLGFASHAFLSWLKTGGRRWRTWRGAGGRREVMRGAGVGACMLGRRRVSQNVLYYCMMLFCRLMFMTDGGGLLIPLTAIQSREPINISRRRTTFLKGDWWKMCGISKLHWRWRCLLGDFFEIDYLRKITCYDDKYCIRTT